MIAPENVYVRDIAECAQDLYRQGGVNWPDLGEARSQWE